MKELIKLFSSVRLVLLAAVFMLVASTNTTYAVHASPEPVSVTQPDGSQLMLKIHGDEFFNYTTTLDGYIVARSSNGAYCYADYNTGKLRVSTTQARQGFYIGGTKSIPALAYQKIRSSGINKLLGTEVERIQRAQSAQRAGGESGSQQQPLKVLVVLVEYPDKPFYVSNPRQAFDDMLNVPGYSSNQATGSLLDYYEASSFGEYKPQFDVVGPFVMPGKWESYRNSDQWRRHAIEALKAADATVDYTQYTTLAPSEVDIVLIYYAGLSSAETTLNGGVWPHTGDLTDEKLMLDGVQLTDYSCSSELKGQYTGKMAGIGTMAHEFAHYLGLADLYSVGNESNQAATSWAYLNIMNKGNYNKDGTTPPLMSAPQREKLGWLTYEDIDESKVYTLEPLHVNNKAYRVKADIDGEYFSFENRSSDNPWDLQMKGQGMIIYHMDYSTNAFTYQGMSVTAKDMWSYNKPNTAEDHQCGDFVEATGYEYAIQTTTDLFFPGTLNVTSIGYHTKPGLTTWSKVNLGVEITDIKMSGSNISFKVENAKVDHSKAQLAGTVRNVIGVLMPGVNVAVYEAAAAKYRTFGDYYSVSAPEKASDTPLFSATTNAQGTFDFVNIEPEKDYLFEFKKTGYQDLKETKRLIKGNNTLTFNVVMREDHPDVDKMKWAQTDGTNAYGVSDGGLLYAAIKFSPIEVKAFKQDQISSVSVRTDSRATNALLTIKVGATDQGMEEKDGTVLVKDLRMEQAEGGLYTFDLKSLNIKKDNSKTLTVIIRTNGGVFVDESGASIANKGDRISFDDKTWRRISTSLTGVDGNWVISVNTGDGTQVTLPYPAIAIEAGGYSVGSQFIPNINNKPENVESVTYAVNGEVAPTPTSAYTFETAGSYNIVVKIKYTSASGLGTETITRKINVK